MGRRSPSQPQIRYRRRHHPARRPLGAPDGSVGPRDHPLGTPCRGVRSSAVGAVAQVEGAQDLEADLVVGADGHRSVVRSLFAPPGSTTPTGWASLQGLTAVPLAMSDGTTSIYATGQEGGIGLMPAGGGLLQWWFDVPWPPDPLPSSVTSWRRDRFARWRPPMRDLLANIADDDIEPFPHGGFRCPDGFRRTGSCSSATPCTQSLPFSPREPTSRSRMLGCCVENLKRRRRPRVRWRAIRRNGGAKGPESLEWPDCQC